MSNGHSIIRHEEKPQTGALATLDSRSAIAPRNPDDVWRMAQTVAKSGLYGCKSVEEAMVRIATGMELGLSPMQSIRGVYVISTSGVSRPTLSADMMVAVVKNRPDICKFFRLVESTDKIATYETQRIGEPSPVKMSYTIQQAQRAGLAGKGTWQAHPEAMLRARAASSLARAVYPDVLNGLYDPSELEDIADTRPAQTATVVESRVVEPEPQDRPITLTEGEYSFILKAIEDVTDEGELKKIGKQIADTAMSEEQRKGLRAEYAKRRNKIAKIAREAASAQEVSDAQEVEAEVVHAGND